MSETTITLDNRDEALLLFGSRDQNLRAIRDALSVRLVARGDELHIEGDEFSVSQAERVFQQLRDLLRHQGRLSTEEVRTVLDVVQHGSDRQSLQNLAPVDGGRHVRPRTDGQAHLEVLPAVPGRGFYLLPVPDAGDLFFDLEGDALYDEGLEYLFGVVGPLDGAAPDTFHISLGFLPGDIVAKVNPYLRPLFDALNDMMEPEQVKRYMENDIIEIVPLAYMRGRTLNQAVIILDEGQNTTIPQMKMFLTRMGNGSKIIVTGDITQVDLPRQMRSGLIDAVHRLRDLEQIAIIYLNEFDIVRHPLVQKIVRAYEEEKARKKP